MATAPWIVSDELWELVEPLLPKLERRFRYPGRKRLLHGIPYHQVPDRCRGLPAVAIRRASPGFGAVAFAVDSDRLRPPCSTTAPRFVV